MKTYQFVKQHFASYLLAPFLLWLCCSAVWIDLAIESVADSLRGNALFIVGAALAALAWLFARFFRYVAAPKLVEFDFAQQQLVIDGTVHRFDQLSYCLLSQKGRVFKLALESSNKPEYAANGKVKTPQVYSLNGDVEQFSNALAPIANIEIHTPSK